MKLRNKLILLFSLLFTVLLLVFSFFIYASTAKNRKEEYYKSLHQQAITKANLLLDAKISPAVLQLIYKNASLFEEEVAIYDTAFHLLYHDAVEIDKVKETRAMINEIVQQKEIRFMQGNTQVVGLLYMHDGASFVITAAAKDADGLAMLNRLKLTLIFSVVASLVLILLAAYFFSAKALQPVAQMVDKVQEITATHLDLRIPVRQSKDEIGELAATFNGMLDRLENSFEAQKQFVSNVSHELRTPLSSIIAELELSLTRERSPQEYRQVIQLALQDTRRLVKLSNGLLDFAKASYDQTGISRKEIRLDELLLDARDSLLKSNIQYKINILFEREIEDDNYISVYGNEYLLKVAFINLMENGCKFSPDHQANVAITYFADETILRFSDHGVGIPEEDLPQLFRPFYRGTNKQVAEGNGIGLSLTHKIIGLHQGSMSITSAVNE